jgi:site-specific recombinase XerD
LRAQWAAAALADVDPGRVRGGFAVGLRDAALLALLAGGLTCAEAARLSCESVTFQAKTGRVVITLMRRGWSCTRTLSFELSAHVVAWLSESRGYGERRPLLVNAHQRALSRVGLNAILARYRDRKSRAAA